MQTNTTDIANVRAWYVKKMLYKAKPFLLHTKYAQVNDIPQHASSQIKFRRYSLLNPATTPLTEGLTPSGSKLAVTTLTTDLYQYGDFIELTDALTLTTEDPILNETNDVLAQQAANTLDQITRDVLTAGSQIQYASTAVSRVTVTAAMKLSAAEVREAVRTLKNANAVKITSMVNPTDGIDTTPLNDCFISFIHPNSTFDLKSDPLFVPVENYPSQASVMPGEIGKVDEVRFIETTNAKVFTGAGAAGVDVYATMILAAHAYGVSRISGAALEVITHQAGSAGTADALNQRSTHGWKSFFAAMRLNETFMVRIEHGATAA